MAKQPKALKPRAPVAPKSPVQQATESLVAYVALEAKDDPSRIYAEPHSARVEPKDQLERLAIEEQCLQGAVSEKALKRLRAQALRKLKAELAKNPAAPVFIWSALGKKSPPARLR